MGHANRGRITVDLDGNWRLYQSYPLAGWEMLGTVTRSGETGALACSPVGIYAQINNGAVRSLDQRKVRAALEAANGA